VLLAGDAEGEEQNNLISTVPRRRIDRPLLALLISFAVSLLSAAPASAAPWTQPGYLYRYFVWGAQRLIAPRSDDYKSYVVDDYRFMGIGTYGQFLFVSPKDRVVIVRTADEDGIDPPLRRQVFQYIADAVAQKGQPQGPGLP
jgi:CubicO group peptidase (beta-lactamase class C family)